VNYAASASPGAHLEQQAATLDRRSLPVILACAPDLLRLAGRSDLSGEDGRLVAEPEAWADLDLKFGLLLRRQSECHRVGDHAAQ
jgi:hypothetical protein